MSTHSSKFHLKGETSTLHMRALSRFWLRNLRWKILIYLSFTLQKESSIIFFSPMFSLHRKTTRGRPFRKFVIISGLELFPDCTCYLVFISLSSVNLQLLFRRPVMHYFFLERFLHPPDWFEKRLAYTRSVAASSMVSA